MNYFPIAVSVLNAAAGFQYVVSGQYWLALAWFSYSIATLALAFAGTA